MKREISGRVLGVLMTVFLAAVGMLISSPPTKVWGQNAGYIVWVKDSPCSGEFDMLSVANENPTYGGGGSFFYPADQVVTGFPCTKVTDLLESACTFAAAEAAMASIKASVAFPTIYANHCCRDYSVWRNDQTGAFSIVQGKFGYAPPVEGWSLDTPDLCCKEAEVKSGLTGFCGGTTGGGNMEFDIDRPGQDFQNFDLSSADPAMCEYACNQNPNCQAWTYVKPNTTQGPNPRCWLKTGIPGAVSATCCVSGVKGKAGGNSGGSKCPPGKIEILGVCGEPGPNR